MKTISISLLGIIFVTDSIILNHNLQINHLSFFMVIDG